MAKYSSKDVAVSFDNSAGSPQVMTSYITKIGSLKKSVQLADITPFGVQDMVRLWFGMRDTAPITISGFYDDTASTGPDVIFNDVGCAATSGGSRTLLITWGGTKTSSTEVIITDYERGAEVGKLHTYTVTLQPTGTVTEA